MDAPTYRVARLRKGDERVAQKLFSVMQHAFDEEPPVLSDPYVSSLLARDDLWVIAASSGEKVIGGLTAHVLPMTRSESSELFIYDLAVDEAHRRRGVARLLVAHLLELGRAVGIQDAFVPADDDDTHALEFYRAIGGAPQKVTFFNFSEPAAERA